MKLFNNEAQPRMPKELLNEQMHMIEENNQKIYYGKSTPIDEFNTTRYGSKTYTLYECFENGRKSGGDYLGYRKNGGPYQFYTYEQVNERMSNIGSGYINMFGIVPADENPLIGIIMKNCPEWMMILLANISYSLSTVPIYETFCSKSSRYIINSTNLKIIHTKLHFLSQIIDIISTTDEEGNLKKECQSVEYIVLADDDLPYKEGTLDIDSSKLEASALEYYQKLTDMGVKIVSLKQVEESGKQNPHPHVPPKPETLYMICYTSGTTGNPKGAQLTHLNFTTNVCSATNDLIPPFFKLSNEDCHISYLPLSHTLEQIISFVVTYLGLRIGYYSGNVMNVVDDIVALQPTVFATVPRLLTRVYSTIQNTIKKSSIVTQTLFNLAYQRKLKMLKDGFCNNDTVWDKLVFSKIQKKFGGKLRVIITGSAPIDPDILIFLRVTLGCYVLEGYGSTELCAVATLSLWGDYLYPYGSHVGIALSCNQIRLDPIPESEYCPPDGSNENYGEICFRGRPVMKGYYKDPEETSKVIDENGWFHTGDIGRILPNRTVQIIGRKKFIFKLAQGEYVSPENIENVYCMCPYVAQCCIVGHTYASCLVGVVVPDFEKLRRFLMKQSDYSINVSSSSTSIESSSEEVISVGNSMVEIADLADEEICKQEKVKKLIFDQMKRIAKDQSLKGYEQAKDIQLIPNSFTSQNGLLTPTEKNCRHLIKKLYNDTFVEMFNGLNQNTKGSLL